VVFQRFLQHCVIVSKTACCWDFKLSILFLREFGKVGVGAGYHQDVIPVDDGIGHGDIDNAASFALPGLTLFVPLDCD
jgi:hypothetical protein